MWQTEGISKSSSHSSTKW